MTATRSTISANISRPTLLSVDKLSRFIQCWKVFQLPKLIACLSPTTKSLFLNRTDNPCRNFCYIILYAFKLFKGDSGCGSQWGAGGGGGNIYKNGIIVSSFSTQS